MRIVIVILALLGCFAARSVAQDPSPLDDLIERLESGSWEDREAATRGLIERGREALGALSEQAEHPDPEIRRRIGQAIEAIRQ